MRILVADTEVFRHDWCFCATDVTDGTDGTEYCFWNDVEAFREFYEKHQNDLLVMYNGRHYDQYIIKAILCGMNPYDVSHWIIKEDRHGWEFSKAFKKVPLNFFDVQFDRNKGLKQIEGFMGMDIQETEVDFDIDRPLTEAERELTIEYCKHDVLATIRVLEESMVEFRAYMNILSKYHRPLRDMCKTKAQLAAVVLGAKRPEKARDDEWDFSIVDSIKLDKYTHIKDWYMNPANRDKKSHMVATVAGLKTMYRWGGLHSATPNFNKKGCFLLVDVGSYYPALMIQYQLLSRNVSEPSKFVELRDDRIAYKGVNDDMAYALKILINAVFGSSGFEDSALYDPMMMRAVCANGQLMLTMLMEMVEDKAIAVNGNTDGIIFEIDEKDKDAVIDICMKWEELTGMSLDYKFYDALYQKDVNGYVLVKNGKPVKRVGDYVKKSKPLDNDLPIVRDALVELLVNGTKPEDIIYPCDDLMRFQKIVKVGSTFSHVEHNGKVYRQKVYRVFASKDECDDVLYKVKDGSPHKVANISPQSFIYNESVVGVPCPSKLDKDYYVWLVYKRYHDYTVGTNVNYPEYVPGGKK